MRQLAILFLVVLVGGCGVMSPIGEGQKGAGIPGKKYKVVKTDAEWKKQLGEKAYLVLRQRDTETAFTGKYWDHHEKGTYTCAGCGQELFFSNTKFDSGTGWPSFYKPIKKEVLDTQADYDMGFERTEVMCSRCGGHLGHVFDDGPKPTGLRYCMNSASLGFKKASGKS